MAGEDWTECKLADACSSIDYGFTASPPAATGGPRFLRITDIVSGSIDWNSVPHVAADHATEEKYRLDSPAKDVERYIALEDMPSKSIDLSNFQPGSAVNSSIIAFRKVDTLFGLMRPYFHKVGLAFFGGITRTTTFVLRPKHEWHRHFPLFHLFCDEVVEFATTASVRTTIPYVKWDALQSYEIALPPESHLAAFEKVVAPLVQRIAPIERNPAPSPPCATCCCPSCCRGSCACGTLSES